MSVIRELLELDYVSVIMTIFIILFGVVSAIEIIGKFSLYIGKPVNWVKKNNADHELLIKTSDELTRLKEQHEKSVTQSIKHDQMIKEDLNKLTDTVNGIAKTLEDMKEKENETKIKELKDRIVKYYNRFKSIGEWSKVDKDVFWDLFNEYEKRGGDGYVHSVIEPVMRELNEID